MVFDLRFLKNPHWEPDLKALTGLDAKVGQYVESDDGFADFIQNLQNLILPLLPRFGAEGKSYLTIALGCTGGKHRSVYVARLLTQWLSAQGIPATSEHRDIDR
jgi:UPF0042 nucleotide-binding protein